jgi:5,10-methylene-tetrahydrofolate dehydrogenase/methenyl tetrahydrofolate cyclohydrolase
MSDPQQLRTLSWVAIAAGAGYVLGKKMASAGGSCETKTRGELIDGKAISQKVKEDVKAATQELVALHGVKPGLAVILVGERKDSQSYVRNKKKMAAEVDFHTVDVDLPDTVSQADLLKEVEKLNNDPKVHAILVQLPLPKHIDEPTVLKAIKVEKDADGFSAANIGNLCLKGGDPPLAVPCTPAGCIELLQRSNVELSGKKAVVIGRSNIVGMPVSNMLQSCDCTVTVCHSRTKNMKEIVRSADIVVAAIGKAFFVKGDWLKPGCVVIDVGINSVDDATKKAGYRLVGDVDFESAKLVASQITPVPGGVGPMTISMLMKNTLNLARHSIGLERIPLRRQQSR